jgi:hypothetical protein
MARTSNGGYSEIFRMSSGHTLETELIDTFATFFHKSTGKVDRSVFRFSTKEEDKFFGTDAFMYGLPVDFTCNMMGKNHTTILDVSVELLGIGRISFGVRTGNGRIKFETPVLVIGVDADTENGDISHILKTSLGRLTDAVMKQAQAIVDVGSDAYWNYCDNNGLA